MNKAQIAETLRQEIGELEVSIQKLQARCEKLKTFVLDLEMEISGPPPPTQSKKRVFESDKFRKVVDGIFGEKPKSAKKR